MAEAESGEIAILFGANVVGKIVVSTSFVALVTTLPLRRDDSDLLPRRSCEQKGPRALGLVTICVHDAVPSDTLVRASLRAAHRPVSRCIVSGRNAPASNSVLESASLAVVQSVAQCGQGRTYHRE